MESHFFTFSPTSRQRYRVKHALIGNPTPHPPLSSSLVAPLCQCLVSCISVFLCRNSCNNILARGDKIQPPRYMHVPSSLVHLAQPYTMSLGTHNLLLRVCVRFVGPYLQEYRENTMNYIHIPFGGASSSNDALHCMQSNRG